MRHISIIMAVLGLIVTLNHTGGYAAGSTVPSTAGGFSLDRLIGDYDVENHASYLNEVIITDLKGFRKGFITYGTCQSPGKILRIKLKYDNRSQDFFNELLQRYRQKFGDKPVFSGDPFGNVKSWKWSFTDEQGRRVNLTLQHNLRDTDESIGNMVKLSMPGLMDEERLCFNKLYDADGSDKEPADQKNPDWQVLIPN